jgi:multicomponent Na+:H+ antiporter subunit D
VGALFAFRERHIKRLLAFSTISHAGMFLAGFALLTPLGLAGAALYVVGHGFVKAALFLGAGIVLHRLRSVNETWLHGRGKPLVVTGVIFTAAGFGLADLPPFGTFLGKGWIDDSAAAPWLTAIFLVCTVLAAGAVLRVAFGVFYGLGDPPGEDPQMAAESNEETGETDTARQRTPLTMLVPPAVATALALATGIVAMVPRFAAGVETAAARFQDQHAYIATVLNGATVTRAVPLYPLAPADVTVSSVVTGVCSALGAAALALVALYWRRLPLLRRGYEPGAGLTVVIRRFQSGVINDYITWLVAGIAALGGLLAVAIH